MLNSFALGTYYYINSNIHKLHPLIKLISSILIIFSILNTNSFMYIMMLSLLLVILIIKSKIPINIFFKIINYIKYFLLIIFILNILLKINLINSFLIIDKILLVFIMIIILMFSTSQVEMFKGMSLLFKPLKILKISTDKISLSMAFSIHFIPILFEQYKQIIRAKSSRGMIYKDLSIRKKFIYFIDNICSVFRKTLNRLNIMADTLELRHFNVNKKRSYLHYYKFTFYDIITLVISILILLFSFL